LLTQRETVHFPKLTPFGAIGVSPSQRDHTDILALSLVQQRPKRKRIGGLNYYADGKQPRKAKSFSVIMAKTKQRAPKMSKVADAACRGTFGAR